MESDWKGRFEKGLIDYTTYGLILAASQEAETGVLRTQNKGKKLSAKLTADINKCMQRRCDTLRKWIVARAQDVSGGRSRMEWLFLTQHHVLTQAEVELTDRPADRIELLEHHFKLAKVIHNSTRVQFDAGRIGPQSYYPILAMKLEADIELLLANSNTRRSGK